MRLDAMRRKEVVEYLREAADVLRAYHSDEGLRLPGWEDEGEAARLRAAARAIAGDGVDPDEGISVPMSDVGELLTYLADMLEL